MTGPSVVIAPRGRPLGGPFRLWLEFRLVPAVGAWLIRLLACTLREVRIDAGPVEDLVLSDQRFVLSFYHRRLLMMPKAYPFHRANADGERRGVAILSSDSRDGERSAAAWRWFGIHAVRGTAGEQGGPQALVKMIQIVRQGWDLGITVDGPRGPKNVVKPGVLAVSRKTGAWIVPVCVAYARAWRMNTWDGLLVPRPFTTVVVRYGKPYQVPAGASDAEYQARLQAELDGMEVWAERVTEA